MPNPVVREVGGDDVAGWLTRAAWDFRPWWPMIHRLTFTPVANPSDSEAHLFLQDCFIGTASCHSSGPPPWYVLPDGTVLRALMYHVSGGDPDRTCFDVQVDVPTASGLLASRQFAAVPVTPVSA